MSTTTTALQVLNSKGAPALSVAGAGAVQFYLQRERGARLTTLSSQLVGPRTTAPGGKKLGGSSRGTLSGGIDRSALRNEMDAVLAEGAALGPAQQQANLADLVVLAMEVGDVREGRGERSLFVWMYLHLARRLPRSMAALLRDVPHYASWKHLALLYDAATEEARAAAAEGKREDASALNQLRDAIAHLWARQLQADEGRLAAYTAAKAAADAVMDVETDGKDEEGDDDEGAAAGAGAGAGGKGKKKGGKKTKGPAKPRLSLAGKWAPRIEGAFDRRCGLAQHICSELDRLRAAAAKKPAAAAAAPAAKPAAADAAPATPAADEDDAGAEVEDIVMIDDEELDAALAAASHASLSLGGAASAAASSAAAATHVHAHPKFAAQSGAHRAMEMRYRRTLSALGAALDVVEIKMSAAAPADAAPAAATVSGGKRRWHEIVPEHVPSRANKKYRAALLNRLPEKAKRFHRKEGRDAGLRGGLDTTAAVGAARSSDADRVECAAQFIAAITRTITAKPGAGAKTIKGARNQPHELVKICMEQPMYAVEKPDGSVAFEQASDPLVEAMWVSMRNELVEKGSFKPGVPLVDVSGSMTGLPMQAAIALGLLMAQLQPEGSPFGGRFITFESTPRWCDVSGCATLQDAVVKAQAAPWGGSTHFGKAMRLLLDTAIAARLPPEQMPQQLYVFSDMEFSAAIEYEPGVAHAPRDVYGIRDGAQLAGSSKADDDKWSAANGCGPFFCAGRDIRLAFADAGYAAPQVIFWNLRYTGEPTFQAETSTPGVALVSGFSQAILGQFMSGEDMFTAAEAAKKAAAEAEAAAAKAAEEAAAAAKAAEEAAAAAAAKGADAPAAAAGMDVVGDAAAPLAAPAAAGAGGSGSAAVTTVADTPWDVLRKKLGSLRYDRVRLELARRGEGSLAGYTWVPAPADREVELAALEARTAKKRAGKAKAKADADGEDAGGDDGDGAGGAGAGAGTA